MTRHLIEALEAISAGSNEKETVGISKEALSSHEYMKAERQAAFAYLKKLNTDEAAFPVSVWGAIVEALGD